MQQAKYINDLLCECAPENGFAQNAIEYSVLRGNVLLSFDIETDKYQVMRLYDEIIEDYREVQSRHASVGQYPSLASVEEVHIGC